MTSHNWTQVGAGYAAHIICKNCGCLIINKAAPCIAVPANATLIRAANGG